MVTVVADAAPVPVPVVVDAAVDALVAVDAAVDAVVGSAAAQTDKLHAVDWMSFTFTYQENPKEPALEYKLKNGRAYLKSPTTKGDTYQLYIADLEPAVRYGDLTGDGVDEAVVMLQHDWGDRQEKDIKYVYTWKDGKPTLLGMLPDGPRKFRGGDLAAPITIEDQQLHFVRNVYEDGDSNNPVSTENDYWHWDGTKLVEDVSKRTPFVEPTP